MFGIFKNTKNTANICLGFAFLIYVSAEITKTIYNIPHLGYVIAFAEAAMVGGVADWFAVTALFRHPFGLKIPHTAIIPKNKNKIGGNLSNFVRENFLSEDYVRENIEKYPIAEKAGQLIKNNKRYISNKSIRAIYLLSKSINYEKFHSYIKETISKRIDEVDIKDIVLRLAKEIENKGHHQELVDFVLQSIKNWLADPEHVKEVNEWIKKALKTDKDGSSSVFGTIKSWFVGNPDLHQYIDDFIKHLNSEKGKDLRNDIDIYFHRFIESLKNDEAFAEKIISLKNSMMKNVDIDGLIRGFFLEISKWVENDLISGESKIRAQVNELIDYVSDLLIKNETVQKWIKNQALEHLPKIIAENAEKIDNYFIQYIEKLNAHEVSEMIEDKVGNDLQFIRINGTLVGGVIGLAIYSFTNVVNYLIHFVR